MTFDPRAARTAPSQTPPSQGDATQDLLHAVSGRDVRGHQPIVERTRRAIRVADENRRQSDENGRRSIGIAVFALGALCILLAPALWSSVDEMIGGEHFSDLPTQVGLLSAALLLGIVAALAAGWRTRGGQDDLGRDPRNVLR